MHAARCLILAALVALLPTCGPLAPVTAAPASSLRCGTAAGLADLLARHARAYGSEEAVRRALPRSLRGTRTRLDDGATRMADLVLDATRIRRSTSGGPFAEAQGIDAEGAWSLDSGGATLRLHGEEALSIQAEAWVLRRGYLSTPLDATCEPGVEPGKLVVRAVAHAPRAGNPVLTFDQETAALLRADLPLADGHRTDRRFEAWSPPDAVTGVRWPLAWSWRNEDGEDVRTVVASAAAGSRCRQWEGSGDAPSEVSGDACLTLFSPTRAAWPSSGVVRVPMTLLQGQLLLRARVGEREAWALLDSGAPAQAVDRAGPLASAFRAFGGEASGMAATQRVTFDIGTIDSIAVGGLTLSHNLAERMSLPPGTELGDRRPELILGWPLFAMAAVRIDYVRSEVTFAIDAAAVVPRGAVVVPLRIAPDGVLVLAEVEVDDARGWFMVDTGSTGDVDFTKAWSDRHGFPGRRPTQPKRFHFGLGDNETTATVFRLARATLGPVHMHDRHSYIHDMGDRHGSAGIVGEGALSSCASVVFDVAHRLLWFEPPCDRRGTEGLFSGE